MRLILDEWFMEDNIWPLYSEISFIAGYDFGQLDKDAISEGLRHADESKDCWV